MSLSLRSLPDTTLPNTPIPNPFPPLPENGASAPCPRQWGEAVAVAVVVVVAAPLRELQGAAGERLLS